MLFNHLSNTVYKHPLDQLNNAYEKKLNIDAAAILGHIRMAGPGKKIIGKVIEQKSTFHTIFKSRKNFIRISSIEVGKI